ncbi:MAG: hypothetical protein HYW91_02125 [Candidatus Sungbacteria bacterium]|nr:hypothetical protein [Candidatus Sungbacteria bacterium]
MSSGVSPDNTYWLENGRARLKKLEEHRNDPWSRLSRMFGHRTVKTLREVMGRYDIRRDRDSAPNETKLPKKWTPERIADLREHKDDSWPDLEARCSCSKARIEKMMSANRIRRTRPESLVWTDEHDRILAEAARQSTQFTRNTLGGRRELRRLWQETAEKLKDAGFEGSVTMNSLHKHLEHLDDARLAALEIQGVTAPLGWGMSEETYAAAKAAALELSTPQGANVNWWPRLTTEQRQEFLVDFRSDFRLPGHTNADYCDKWSRIIGEPISEQGLSKAARYFGEMRNRVQIAHGYKTSGQIEKAIEARMVELIQRGVLTEEGGPDAVYAKLKEEFREGMERSQYELTKEKFFFVLNRVVWTEGPKGTITTLTEIIRREMPLERFTRYHPYIPPAMVEKKAEWLRGVTNKITRPDLFPTPTLPGINRFMGEDALLRWQNFELPDTSFANPCVIPTTGKNWCILVINGANLGLVHDPIMKANAVRRALAEAEYRKVDAVLMMNMTFINTLKAAGPSRVTRALLSGIDVDLDLLAPAYQERVRQMISRNGGENERIIYVTREELLKTVMKGYHKVTWRPDKDEEENPTRTVPEYLGPIFISFGPYDSKIVDAATYWTDHHSMLMDQAEARAEAAAAESAYTEAVKQLRKLDERREILDARLQAAGGSDEEASSELAEIATDTAALSRRAEVLKQELAALKELVQRTKITNINDPRWQRSRKRAIGHMAMLFESILPKCKVTSLGNIIYKVGDKMVKLHIPGRLGVTDTLLADFTNSCGPAVIREEMADLTIIGSPHALRYAETAREVDAEGQRGSALVCVAPDCINDAFVREKLKTVVDSQEQFARLVRNEQVKPGVLLVSCINGVISVSPIRIEALAAHERRKKKQLESKPRYLYWLIETDKHVGGKAREALWKDRGVRLGPGEAFFHMLRAAGYGPSNPPPIHGYAICDDPNQADHFNAYRQPHPNQMPYWLIEKHLGEIREKSKRARDSKKKDELHTQGVLFALQQFNVRGIDWFGDQLEEFHDGHLKPNVDIFDAILRRTLQSGLVLRGISELTPRDRVAIPYDRRDPGMINLGTGNHSLKTVLRHLAEGRILSIFLRDLLRAVPFWNDKDELLERLVKGPIYGNDFISFGTIQAPGGYEWGLDFRNTPPAMNVNWGDPLLMAIRTDLRRGNYPRIFQKKVALKVYGDKHFYTASVTDHAIYLMGPASTHTDSFGELGFPPNSTGIALVGLPAEGPAAGPILFRPLLYDHLKRFIDGNESLDFEKFLPDPL